MESRQTLKVSAILSGLFQVKTSCSISSRWACVQTEHWDSCRPLLTWGGVFFCFLSAAFAISVPGLALVVPLLRHRENEWFSLSLNSGCGFQNARALIYIHEGEGIHVQIPDVTCSERPSVPCEQVIKGVTSARANNEIGRASCRERV